MWLSKAVVVALCYLMCCQLYSCDDISPQCGATQKHGFKVSIVSHHNQSGHYIEQVLVQDSSGKALSINQWNMNVKVENTTCLGRNCSLIEADLSQKSASPPGDYDNIMDTWYFKYHPKAMTWGEAKMICESEGGHLAVMSSELARYMVIAVVQRHIGGGSDIQQLLMGYNAIVVPGEYRTVQGVLLSCLDYNTWASGQPIVSAGNCVAINQLGELMVVGCDVKLPFMCQWES